MSLQAMTRIKKEYREICEASEKDGGQSGVSAELVGDSFIHWKGTIKGPQGTSYEGGIFTVDIKIPSNYPFEPPKMQFDTKVWHPNISSANGAICLDILKKEWSPALTLRTALLSLQALLCTPNADDPQDAQVASQYKSNRKEFEATAKFWTQCYATANSKDAQRAKIQRLMEMGFGEAACAAALEKTKGDENAAVELLMQSA